MHKTFTIWMLFLFILIFDSGVVFAQDDDLGLLLDTELIEGDLCGSECLTHVINVTMTPQDFAIEAMDIVFLIDISSSMGNVLNTVKNSTTYIADELRLLVPDTRFGLGVFSDYSDVPWNKISDLEFDINDLNTGLNQVSLEYGGDGPESQTRALYEALEFAWRDDALKMVIVFTDNVAHRTDRGRDGVMGTADDLEFEDVLADYANRNIYIIGIDSGSGRRDLSRAAEVTSGQYFELDDFRTIPENIITIVTGIVLSQRFSFNIVDERYDDWLEQSPTQFAYIDDGGTQRVEITICPEPHTDEKVSLDTTLELSNARSVYGEVALRLDYAPYCVLLNVPDVPEDDGLTCSENGTFWQSSAITIESNGTEVVAGGTYSVYVDVRNLGVRSTQGEVTLYEGTMENWATSTATTAWTAVSSLPLTIDGEAEQRIGPFLWTPQNAHVMLRAIATSPDDQPDQPNDYVCEGQIAHYQDATLPLPIYSIQPGFALGSLPTTWLNHTQASDRLAFVMSDLQGEDTIQLDGDVLGRNATLSPDDVVRSIIAAQETDTLQLILERGGTPRDGITLALDYDKERIQMMLAASDVVVEEEEPSRIEQAQPFFIGLGVALLVLALPLVVFVAVKRNKKQN